MDWTNADRAKRGETIRNYLADLYEVDKDDESWLIDTLTDLMHAGTEPTALDRALWSALGHYGNEKDEPHDAREDGLQAEARAQSMGWDEEC